MRNIETIFRFRTLIGNFKLKDLGGLFDGRKAAENNVPEENAGKEKNFIGKYTKENTGSDTGRKDSAGRHPG